MAVNRRRLLTLFIALALLDGLLVGADDACVCPPETKCVCGEEEVFEEVREAEEQEHEKKLQEEKYKSGYESPALEDLSSEMQYRHLGSSGLKVSALSYGAWVTFGNQLSTDQAFDIMSAAYELGINFFDNAETYASGKAESMMGKVLQRMMDGDSGPRRSDLVISTKIFWGVNRGDSRYPNDVGLSRKHIIEGLKDSLKRLMLDYVDIVFAHRPDPATPIEETVRAFDFCINQGLAFYWGTSEWSAVQIREAQAVASRLGLIGPVAEQPEYNVFARERVEGEYMPLLLHEGMGLTIWSPLASGILTGKYNKENTAGGRLNMPAYSNLRKAFEDGTYHPGFDWEQHLDVVAALEPITKELSCSLAQLAIAWCLKNEHVSTVILGGTKVEQLHENVLALQVLKRMDAGHFQKIETILQNKPKPVPDFRRKK